MNIASLEKYVRRQSKRFNKEFLNIPLSNVKEVKFSHILDGKPSDVPINRNEREERMIRVFSRIT